jgi:HSP20 family protein
MASRFFFPLGSARGPLGRGDPFLDLHREVNRLFDDVLRTSSGGQGSVPAISPQMDIHETEDAIEVSAELPGCSPDDVELSVEGETLTIRGEKRNERKDDQAHVVERSYGSFQRTVQLPFAPNPDEVKADFEHGVLKVSVPRRQEQERSRRIQIGGARSGNSDRQTIEGEASQTSGRSAFGEAWTEQRQSGQEQNDQNTGTRDEQAERGQGAPA